MAIELILNGEHMVVADEEASLLDVLRSSGNVSVKDGCSPQGQCGCCTVLVDGRARVSCVTPIRRVAGRSVTSLEGVEPAVANRWADSFCAHGASQCGFCTPGMIMRLVGLEAGGGLEPDSVRKALGAHLCRCTGWQPIIEAAVSIGQQRPETTGDRLSDDESLPAAADAPVRQRGLAERRAGMEGGCPQTVSREIALGEGGFADDTAPENALVAMMGPDGEWHVAESVSEARRVSGRVQGRSTTLLARPPIEVAGGEWELSLRTSWVEPGYLETDATWCVPGGTPSSMLANGGAFGAKLDSRLGETARRLADENGRPVRVLLSREETVRIGPKRPPMAIGLNSDGTGHVRVATTPGVAERISEAFPLVTVTEVDLAGPPTSLGLRGAGWAELAACAAVLSASDDEPVEVVAPEGGVARVRVEPDGRIGIVVDAGTVLDDVVLRSYCIGAAHMAAGWVTSEALAVADDGTVHDLTIRSFGILRAADMPEVSVEVLPSEREPVAVSDAVLAAVAGAVWRSIGSPTVWPTAAK